jgi:hypothetical protein
MGAVRHVCDGGSKVKAKIWGGIEKWISRNAVANADMASSQEQVNEQEVKEVKEQVLPHIHGTYTEQERNESFEFLEHLRRYEISYTDLVFLLNESVDLTIKHAVMELQTTKDMQAIEDYLIQNDVRPGILYDGMRLAPIAYTSHMKHQLVSSGNYVIASYPLLKIFSH